MKKYHFSELYIMTNDKFLFLHHLNLPTCFQIVYLRSWNQNELQAILLLLDAKNLLEG